MVGPRAWGTVFLLLATACGGATRTRAAGNGGAGATRPGDGSGGASDAPDSGGSGGALVASGGTSTGGAFHVEPADASLLPSATPTDPKNCEDNDGLTYDEEIAAGTDPCKADTDGDGCIDGAQVKLGGCDDPRNGVIVTVCAGEGPTARLRFTAPDRDGGSWASLTLKENVNDQAILPLYILATLRGATGSVRAFDATFYDVPGGAELEYDVTILPTHEMGSGVIGVELYAQDSAADAGDAGAPRLVDRGKVLVVIRSCPVP